MTASTNRGWKVAFAGMGINLALGVLYSWSVVSKEIPESWQWTEAAKSLPYSVACLVFAFIMVPAGRMQDKIGPRITATVGGVLVGLGMILASQTTSTIGYVVGFGLLAGAGIGFGYASATPPAVKWFAAAKTGLIAGIVVSGFGLSSVYVAPLAKWLIARHGVSATMLGLGIGFLLVVILLAQLLRVPPAGYVPTGAVTPKPGSPDHREDFTPSEMLKTWQFHVLELMYVCGAGAGLMVISKLTKMVEVQAGVQLGFLLVAILAIGNGAGRIVAGMISDKIGRRATLFGCFLLQAVVILMLSRARQDNWLGLPVVLAMLSGLIGANYGANLALFPAITKDFYGLKNFGVNYGLVFTAWGWGGFGLSLLAGAVYDGSIIASWKGSFTFAYYCSAALLVAAAVVTFFVKPPRHHADRLQPA
jgi:OFA family oxalate/formate antiporter-like MFS transporter